MTHAELYEIVKDHPDVWGQHFIVEDYGGGLRRFVRHFTHQAEECEHAEMELLGLGVAWLVKNSDVTIHEHLHGGIVVWPQLEPGYDDRPKVIRPTLITAVYAAIAEVKRG